MWESVVDKSLLVANYSYFQLNLRLRMCEGILGCFQLTESDNFEEYLEALEMPLPMRKMMAMAKPKVRQTIKPKYLTLLKRLTYQMMATIGPSVTRLPIG